MSTITPLVEDPRYGLNLTGTRIAEYFRFACERQLRYDLAPAPERPAARGGRPGAGLLAAAGRAWERRKVVELVRRLGPSRVLMAGPMVGGSMQRLDAATVVDLLRHPGEVEVLVQPELRLSDPERFARRFGMDPDGVRIAPAVPDLIRIRRLADGRRLFQIVDIKASATARIPHFAQIAYYSLLLDEICRVEGIRGGITDRRWGRVWARDGRGPARFALAAYRHHVAEVLRRDLPRVIATAPEACAWHLSARCAGCGYLAHCQGEADTRDDLARIAGVTPVAKQLLASRGIRSVRDLANRSRKDTYRGCHALESQADRLAKRASALTYGKVFDVDTRTHLMPRDEDARVILSAEGDPVSGRCFALGLRLEWRGRPSELPGVAVWIADGGSAPGERAILASLLSTVERILVAVDAERARPGRRSGASIHFYVYDRAEMDLLRELLLRHLGDGQARPAIARLLAVLSPRGVAVQPDAIRAASGTLVSEVVSTLFALPVPYAYDLAAVSDRLRPTEQPRAWKPRADYGWPFSSQVAFERIHNVWRGKPHRAGGAVQSPQEVREEIQRLIVAKLAAVDSVIRAVRERSARLERLQMRKDPFVLAPGAEPLRDPDLEAMRVFTELESAAEAAALQALHVLPAAERARRFECIRGLSLLERRDDGTLLFEFDPGCRDSKLRPGEFNLVLTNDDDRSLLEVDRQPWKRRRLMVELVGYEMDHAFPRVTLAPSSGLAKAEADGWIDLDRLCALDRAPSDFNTSRILATLTGLDRGAGEAAAVLDVLRGQPPAGWPQALAPADDVYAALLEPAARALGRPVLNRDQETAWRGVFQRSASLIWGPPGTGKTYLLAWTILGLAVAARKARRPLRVLVTAATHRAVVNVLSRLHKELVSAGVEIPLSAVKLRGSGNEADADLRDTRVAVVEDAQLPGLLEDCDASGVPLVVGSTVWSLWKQMRRASGAEDELAEGRSVPVASWFDVVVIDEASQIKVPEALVALSSIRRGARVILCGDDRQLAPVLRGRYGPDSSSLFGSAFEHFARHTERDVLRESRRMNAALVEYPRRLFYPGLVSMDPRRRLRVSRAPLPPESELLRELFLTPEHAVVLCTYRGVRATARNLFEARLAADLTRLACEVLLDPATGERFTPEALVSEGLALISPHRAQNSAILAELRALGLRAEATPVVDTVERMQGNEREMVIVSYGVADREYAEAEAEFLLSPNRFNVAITRARSKLIVLVSEEVLLALPADETVMDGSMALKGYVAHCRDGVRDAVLPGPDGSVVAVRCSYRALRD